MYRNFLSVADYAFYSVKTPPPLLVEIKCLQYILEQNTSWQVRCVFLKKDSNRKRSV